MDVTVPLLSKRNEIEILRDYLASRSAEIDLEGRHVAAKVAHVEDQVLR